MGRLVRVASCLGCSAVCGLAAVGLFSTSRARGQVQPPPRRDITVNVTVRTQDGTPVEGAPVGAIAFHGDDMGIGAFTDVQGQTTINMSVLANATKLILHPSVPGKMVDAGVMSPNSIEFRRVRTLFEQWSFAWAQGIDLDATQTTYQAVLTAWPATKVTGTLVHADGTPVRGQFTVRGTNLMAPGGVKKGQLQVWGLRRGVENEVLAAESNGGRVLRIAMSAEQCAAESLDLGNIVIGEDAAGGRLGVRLTNFLRVVNEPVDYCMGISVVSEDGSRGYELWGIGPDGVVKSVSGQSLLPLPAGTYYVGPGRMIRGSGAKLWKVVRTHTATELENAGITKVTIVAGEDKQITIDAVAGRAAILALGGPD